MKSTPPSGSPRAAARLPRLSIPTPSYVDSGATLLISPRRLTGTFSPKGARNSFDSSSTTNATTNAPAACPGSSASSLSGRARRTTSESNEAISILESALAEFKARVKAAREEKAAAAAAATAAKASAASAATEAAPVP